MPGAVERARGRPRGRTLDRARVVAAARRLARHGVEHVTMGSVAAALGVTPMALYRHVRNKHDLLALVIDDILADIEVPPGTAADWTRRIHDFHRAVTDALAAYPGMGEMLIHLPPLENSGRLLEGYLAILLDSGIDEREAVMAYTTLYYLAMGVALNDSAGRPTTPALTPPEDYPSPLLGRLAGVASGVSREEIQDYAVGTVIAAIERRLAERDRRRPASGRS